jgi:hypothetical protein
MVYIKQFLLKIYSYPYSDADENGQRCLFSI